MGADIYLQSLYKTFEEKLPPPSASESQADFRNRYFGEMYASGCYFRNSYNSGDVMWAMGLSWIGTVLPMLEDKYRLPIGRARELIEMIEARPLTRKRVAAHIFEHMTNGINEHPVTGPIQRLMEEDAGQAFEKLLPPDLDDLFGFLNTRRDKLLTILRKSIELDERLYCSL